MVAMSLGRTMLMKSRLRCSPVEARGEDEAGLAKAAGMAMSSRTSFST